MVSLNTPWLHTFHESSAHITSDVLQSSKCWISRIRRNESKRFFLKGMKQY